MKPRKPETFYCREFFNQRKNNSSEFAYFHRQIERAIKAERRRLGLTVRQRGEYLNPNPRSRRLPAELRYKPLTGDVMAVEVMADLARRSVVITEYTFLESTLYELCDCIKANEHLAVAALDLAGQGIERAAKYIQLTLGLNIRAGNEWREIRLIQYLRNLLVHANGGLDRSDVARSEHIAELRRRRLITLSSHGSKCVLTVLPGCTRWAGDCVHSLLSRIQDLTSDVRAQTPSSPKSRRRSTLPRK